MSKIDGKHVKNVCRIGEGAFTCSYLSMGVHGFECTKGTSLQNIIEKRRIEKSTRAMGDNCSGPPDFTPTEESMN